MLVVGPKEAEQGAVSVRDRIESKDLGMIPLAEAIEKFETEVREKAIRQQFKSTFQALEETSEESENEY